MKLINGDCLEEMQKIDTGSVDMVLCDLPYGTTDCKWDKHINFKELWKEYERIINPTGAICLFASSIFTYKLIESNQKLYKYKWVWIKAKKSNFVNAKNRPMTQYEEVLVFSKGTIANGSRNKMIYNPQGLIKVNKKSKASKSKFGTIVGKKPSHKEEYIQEFTNYPSDILYFNSVVKPQHPTQKPIELLEYLIKTYTNEGELILDNCMGSGSTGVAAKHTNRKFIGIELDKNYFEIAKKRIEEE